MKYHRNIFVTIAILITITVIGFYSKFYSGIGHEWVNNKLGGAFYEIFWCLLVLLIAPKIKPLYIAIGVFIATCILEFLQLVDTSFLELIRSNFIGRTIIGSSFSWGDFLYYAIGSLLGFFLLRKF